jgi:glycosyltransferase involved in cell wall biosynthesis
VSGTPEVSVVIPTHNRWGILSTAALAAALAQENVDHEIVVVDDGSTDETADRLARLESHHVRTVRHERAQGVARARNAGIAAASGRWIAFLDDDDLWAPTKLRAQIDAAEVAGAVFAYAGGAGLDGRHRFLFAVPPPDPATVTRELLRWNVIWCGCSNVLARADVVRELGGFDEELVQLADWDLWIRLALAGPAAATPEILVGYVMHEGSMLLTDRADVFPELDHLVAKHGEASTRYGVAFDRALFSRWVARGHRRAGRRALAARTFTRGAIAHRDPGSLIRAAGSFFPERVVDASRRLAAVERRSRLTKEYPPEPAWIARFRPSTPGAT